MVVFLQKKGAIMKKAITLLVAALVLGACGANRPVQSNAASNMPAADAVKSVTIATVIPYQKGAPIAANVRRECTLNSQLSEFIQSYGKENNIGVIRTPRFKKNDNGNVLHIEIVNAVSQGNAFLGHRKFTQIEGTLFNSGKKVAGFTAARFSGGGFFGGYKGSCSVLGRTVKTLGKDIAEWLTNPIDGMHMGDGV